MNKKAISIVLLTVLSPLAVIFGAVIFSEKQYAFVSLFVAVLACISFFLAFEKRSEKTAKKTVIIAVMIALCVVGRLIFAPLQGFKPVTAIIIITAMYFGCESGFMTGALTALISNFYFGQGPWTPFQMIVWGLIGLTAGVLAKKLKSSTALLLIFGAISAVAYSLLMDIWTVLWADNAFNITRYLAAVISALPITAEYIASNIVFLLILSKPLGKKLDRICTKYGIE